MTMECSKTIHDLDKEIAVLRTTQLKDMEAADKALELQAIKYEERLKNLNHEAQQLKDMQATYTPRETFDAKIDSILKAITELKEFRDTSIGRNSVVSAVIAVLVSLLTGYFLRG